jgi:hypothetical protein
MADFPLSSGAGYLHPLYADSLSEFGLPRCLPESGGWILKRPIGRSGVYDAMGLYPLFLCTNWSKLPVDLEHEAGIVSLAVVADPFGDHTPDLLRAAFPDVMLPFKEHFVVDLAAGGAGSRRHRYYARKALKDAHVEAVDEPIQLLDAWTRLYDVLIARHKIRGIARFSRDAFEKQLRVPGIVAFRATYGEEIVGITLWYRRDEFVYWHLGAFSETGYRLCVSYALVWSAIQYFRDMRARWIDLGGGAGAQATEDDTLGAYKKGWATETRTAYFCGRILDRERYSQLARADSRTGSSDYFPAYRAGEFG